MTHRNRLDGSNNRRACLALGAWIGAGIVVAVAGCDLQTDQMKQSESVLAPLWGSQPTEFDAILWANDEFDADKRARGTALLAFSPVGDKPIYIKEVYVPHLADKDSNVRAVSAFALGMHGSPDHVPAIVPLLKDPDRHVRLNAARALQRLHNPAAVDGLLAAVDPKEEDTDVRAEAADALGQYAETRVVGKLIAALDDPQLIVNRAAMRSLQTLTGMDLPDDRLVWTRWEKDAKTPFAGQRAYVYPVFSRDKRWLEYIPFVPDPPNESPGQPAGMQALGTGP